MRFLGFCTLSVIIILFGCEKNDNDNPGKYPLSALERNGDTIALFTYSNDKLMVIERPNRTHTFFYDSLDRIIKVTGLSEYTFKYLGNNRDIYLYVNGRLSKEIELNEVGNPANVVAHAIHDYLSIYEWDGDNLIGISTYETSLVYNSYPNPFYKIINNYLWKFIYIEVTGLSDFDFIVIPSKNFVAKVIRTIQATEEYEISYTYDEKKNLVTSVTNLYGDELKFLYEL